MSYRVDDLPLNTWMSEGKNAGHAYRGETHFGRVYALSGSLQPWRAQCRPQPLRASEPGYSPLMSFDTVENARKWVENWKP